MATVFHITNDSIEPSADLEPLVCDLSRKTQVAMRAAEGLVPDLPPADGEALVDFLEGIALLAGRLRQHMIAASV